MEDYKKLRSKYVMPYKKKLNSMVYTDQATAACQQSDYQFVRIEGATWSA
jgi:hypothetical protein